MTYRHLAAFNVLVALCHAACAVLFWLYGSPWLAAVWAFDFVIWLGIARLNLASARLVEETAAIRTKYHLDDPLGETIPN